MPKTPSNKLFNLIKSLTGPEKRYFKLFVSNKKNNKVNKYELLFDAIDTQKEYNEEDLKQIVYQGAPIESRKYSELKAYLYELILKSLQGYDEKTAIDFKLKGMLQSVRVLFKRSHYEDATELLHKARKTAYLYESFINILEILNWEKQIAYARSDIAFLDKQLPQLDEEENNCLETLRNLSAYRNIFYRLITSIRKEAVLRSEEKKKRLNKVMDHPLLKDITMARSHQARVLFHRIFGLYYYSVVDYTNFYQSGVKLLVEVESAPHFIREDVSDYIAAISNLALSCGLLHRYSELQQYLDKLLTVRPKTRGDELRIHQLYYAFKFNLCNFTGEFEEGLQTLEEHFKIIEKYPDAAFQTSSFYLQYFNIYFGVGDYDNALMYLNKCLGLPRSIERQDLQSLVRILNLIIHYEMGNTLLLEYLFRSTYRFLRKRNRMFEFERTVLNFIKNSSRINTAAELKAAFQKLQKDFEDLKAVPSEKAMLQYFDFVAWLESKISDQSFSAILRQQSHGISHD